MFVGRLKDISLKKKKNIVKMFRKRTVILQIEIEFIWETNTVLYISVSLNGPKLLDTVLLSTHPELYCLFYRVRFGYVKA